MGPDLRRLACAVILSIVAGLLVGKVFLCLSLGIFICLVWQYRALKRLGRFLRDGNRQDLPDAPGVINEIIRQIDFLRAQHEQREEKLTGGLARFQEATEALPDAVIVMDAYGLIEWANEKAFEYLEVRCPRDNGRRFSNLVRHPELADYLANVYNDKLRESLIISSPVNTDISLEIRITRFAESSILLVARNVTDIQRANRIRKDFIANASHELRTPLTVIAGYLEVFDNEDDDHPQERRLQVKKMRVQADRMQNLLEDLLKLSQLEGDTSSSVDDEVNMGKLISVIHDEAQTLSGAQGHVFFLDIDPEMMLKGDKNNLYSAISNVVFNAVQYTPPGGEIRIKWRRIDEVACLEVADSGEGIPQEHINRVTERFYRVDKGRSRKKGGTGLGLAIVKHVMVQHGAQLKIDSEPGRGTTVRCFFPGHRVIDSERQPAASA